MWSQNVRQLSFSANPGTTPTENDGAADASSIPADDCSSMDGVDVMGEDDGCGQGVDETGALLATHTEAKYLLVIEKQGIFLRLCEDGFHR